MNWKAINQISDLDNIVELSKVKPVLIFKHSTTCSISNTALNRLERKWSDEKAGDLEPHYLDLLNFRPISAEIASKFAVQHESPQALIIKDGKCVYHASHFDITFDEIAAMV